MAKKENEHTGWKKIQKSRFFFGGLLAVSLIFTLAYYIRQERAEAMYQELKTRQDETDSFCETTDFKAAAETEAPLGDLPLSTTLHPEWASFFDGVNGAAVIFDRAEHTFGVYNENLADTRRPPCSTFKIISSLAGLESGVIDPENSR